MATRTRKPVQTPPRPHGPLLSLETFTERFTIVIDRVAYPFLSMDELSIVDYHYMRHGGSRLFELWGKETLTNDEAAEYVEVLHRMSRAIVQAPEAVMAALTDRQLIKICERFMLLPPDAQPAGAGVVGAAATSARSTGAS